MRDPESREVRGAGPTIGLHARAYFLALTGIVCMGVVEGFGVLTASLSILLTWGYWKTARDQKASLDERKERWITTVAFGLAIAEFIYRGVSRESVVFSLGHFLGYAQCVRAFKRRTVEDFPVIFVIGLVHLMLAMVFPPMSLTMACLVIDLLLLPGSLQRLSFERAQARREDTGPLRERWPVAIVLYPAVALVFSILPRDRTYMKWDVSGAWGIAGFSSSLSIGDISSLFPSDEVIMRVRASFPTRWRGKAFDVYEGGSWRVSSEQRTVFSPSRDAGETSEAPSGRLIQEQVYTLDRPIPDGILFASPDPMEILLEDGRLCEVDGLGNAYTPARPVAGYRYRVVSGVMSPSPSQLKGIEAPVPPEIERTTAQPPEVPERVKALAVQIAGQSPTVFDKAVAIEQYLLANYEYSLTPGLAQGEPVDWFLFEARKGFCEHFATAMAVLLRCLNVPARIATGFQEGEMLQSNLFLVRNSDAHAWVEVYFPSLGWVSFDPTPPVGGMGLLRRLQRWLATWLDTIKLRWYRYVVNFSSWNQQRIQAWFHQVGQRASEALRRVQIGIMAFRVRPEEVAAFVAACLLATALLGRNQLRRRGALAWASWSLLRQARIGQAGQIRAALGFYRSMLEILARRGFAKKPHQTAWEFCEGLSELPVETLEDVKALTALYVGVRFADQPLSPEDRSLAAACLSRLKARRP